MLHLVFSPKSVEMLTEAFPETDSSDWESIYAKILGRAEGGNELILYVDGSSNALTRSAGIGGVLLSSSKDDDEREEILTFSENIGEATNNVAEYSALIRGLEYARELKGKKISVFSDSELMVNQLKLEYKVKSDRLMKLYSEAMDLFDQFDSWNIGHIPRSKNRKADILSNQALKKPVREVSSQPREDRQK
ncbi:MAG: ribonuclease HI family protein [Candidatus Neomarinimicrobiota bacterium]